MTEGMAQVWECKQGHRYEAVLPITESICGKCDNDPTVKTSARMRLVEGAKATRAEAGKEQEMAGTKTTRRRSGSGMKRPGSAKVRKSVAAAGKPTARKSTARVRTRTEASPEALAAILEGMAKMAPAIKAGKATKKQLADLQLETRRANNLVRRLERQAA